MEDSPLEFLVFGHSIEFLVFVLSLVVLSWGISTDHTGFVDTIIIFNCISENNVSILWLLRLAHPNFTMTTLPT